MSGEDAIKQAASLASLDKYFSADPNGLSDQDLDVIVAELRRQRESWENGKQPSKRKPASTPRPTLALLGALKEKPL